MVPTLLLSLLACSTPAPWDGPVLSQPRTELTVAQLEATTPAPLLDMSFFARPDWATEAHTELSGTLTVESTTLTLDFPTTRALYEGEDRSPAFSVDLVSHEGALLPAYAGLNRTEASSDSLWDVFVGSGAVWQEAGDGDWSRASLPIQLVDRYFNQVRNCVATFVYTATATSPVALQCSQETADAADDQLGNLRATLPATLDPAVPLDASAIVGQWTAETSSRLPAHPLAELDADGRIAEVFDEDVLTNASTSLGAVYVDDTLFVHPAPTRHGPYPYPSELRHGVFSVTKSLAGALSLFYLAERYGDDIVDEPILDHVPELATEPGWQGVTFGDALNMATGTQGGEAAEQLYVPLVLAETVPDALANIATLGDAPEAPGEAFRYATTHTFVLSVAMERYVAAREGAGTHYWDLVRRDVLEPIHAEQLDVLLTRDPTTSIPYLGFGARPTLDEAAKIARLIANEGEHNGTQLLHRGLIREALGRTEWEGLPISGGRRYRHGFWSDTVRAGTCRARVTYMQGHGGNHIVFFPSGAIAFQFTDELGEDVAPLVRAMERVRSSCGD